MRKEYLEMLLPGRKEEISLCRNDVQYVLYLKCPLFNINPRFLITPDLAPAIGGRRVGRFRFGWPISFPIPSTISHPYPTFASLSAIESVVWEGECEARVGAYGGVVVLIRADRARPFCSRERISCRNREWAVVWEARLQRFNSVAP